jgi:DNA modification methylase
MKIEMRAMDAIKPYENNPRKNDVAVDAVAKSLKTFGFRQPIVVDGDGVIVVGHTRWKAAKQLGLNKVPVHIAADLTPEQARAYRIADNQTNSIADWDFELLPVELTALKDLNFDISLLGFDEDELSRLLKAQMTDGLCDPNEVPEPPTVPVTKKGDLLILGNHRLLCGDSTNPEDVRRLMDGEKAILFATDPPYLVAYDGKNHPQSWKKIEKGKAKGKPNGGNKDWSSTYSVDWDDADADPELYEKFIAVAQAEAIQPNAAWYCWHASKRQSMLETAWEKAGAFVHQQIIWCKDRPVLTRSWFMWQHEPCFMGWVRPNKPPRCADDHPKSVWQIPTVPAGAQTDHPTSKPVEVFAIPMVQHTLPGEVCYEPFSGSGSQHIAAEQLGRRCFGMEISPNYCDVVTARWEKFTGKKAERVPA